MTSKVNGFAILRYRTVAISSDVMSQVVGNEGILLDLKTEQYFGLNDTGIRLWEWLRQSGDVHALLRRLVDEYDVGEEQAANDLNKWVDELVRAGIVTIGD